jgi:hypothetical protein
MTMILPNGVTEASMRAALTEFSAIVGNEWFFGPENERLTAYNDAYPLDDLAQQGYMMSNASLTWRGPENRYSVAVYIDNIENETLKATSVVQPIVGLPVVTLEAPRTYGIRARFNF